MSILRLVIGNKNYSSWSIRPWLLMKQAGISFEEEQLWLGSPDTVPSIAKYSPSGRVPVLIDGDIVVWDSLAICEYLAEKFPDRGLWPAATEARARARAIAAEMHSGFMALRESMPMNIRTRLPGAGRNAAVETDIARVTAIWSECVGASGGPFLFGTFGIADAMYAPVVFRFQTYGVALRGSVQEYARSMLASTALTELARQAAAEGHALTKYDSIYA